MGERQRMSGIRALTSFFANFCFLCVFWNSNFSYVMVSCRFHIKLMFSWSMGQDLQDRRCMLV